MWMLSGQGTSTGTSSSEGLGNSTLACSQDVLKNCKACLDACLLHILNLRGFAQTVLVDTWICSLSYVFFLSSFPFLLFPIHERLDLNKGKKS